MPEAKTETYVPKQLIPADGAEGVGSAVLKMMDQIFDYREQEKVHKNCNRYYKMKRNKHWKYKGDELALLSANLCGTHHKKTVNMITSNAPTFNIVPGGDLGDDGEDRLSLQKNVAENWWNDTEQQMVFRESVDSGELYGTVGESVYLDVEIDFPEGEIMTDTNDMMYMSLYPPECRKIEKAEAFLKWYKKSVRQTRNKYPKKAHEIVGDLSLLEKIGDERKEEHKNPSKTSFFQVLWSGATKLISGEKGQAEVNDTDELYIVECWVKDSSQDAEGNPVYPGNIRRVMVCNDGVVLEDKKNPSLNWDLPEEILQANYLYNRFPHSYIQPVPDNSSPFGLSDFEQLEKLNMELNKAMSQFTMFKDRTSRSIVINPRDSGVSDDELNGIGGVVHPTNHLVGKGIGYVVPPQMGSDIPTALSLYKDLFNEVAGSFSDVTQGQKHGAEVVAAKAIALLLEQESRMAQGKGQAYSKMLRERGRMYLALAQMWYDKPRYVTFQKNGEKITQGVTAEDLRVPGKLNVVSGSTMPVSDIYKREEAKELYREGLIDQEEVLKKLDVDGYQEIIARMQQGPLGAFMKKLSLVGTPEEILQFFQQVGQMEDKEIEKAIKEGELPSFVEIIQELAQGPREPKPDPDMIKVHGELELKVQEIQIKAQQAQNESAKVQVEIAKIQEEIQTEIVERDLKVQEGAIKMKGLELDVENLRLKKAETVSRIQSQRKKPEQAPVDTDGKYDEQGMRSNNVEVTA